jgi:hypothetical protein
VFEEVKAVAESCGTALKLKGVQLQGTEGRESEPTGPVRASRQAIRRKKARELGRKVSLFKKLQIDADS